MHQGASRGTCPASFGSAREATAYSTPEQAIGAGLAYALNRSCLGQSLPELADNLVLLSAPCSQSGFASCAHCLASCVCLERAAALSGVHLWVAERQDSQQHICIHSRSHCRLVMRGAYIEAGCDGASELEPCGGTAACPLLILSGARNL